MNIQPVHQIRSVGTAYQIVRMSCAAACELDDVVAAFINGIKVSESFISGTFAAGEVIEYPVQYLPFVDLPAEIRFVRIRDGAEIATPFQIRTPDDAIALVGLGDIQVEGFSIEHGVARGTANNRVNGLMRPEMFAKINGIVPRAVTVDSHRLLDDGGASFQFSVRIDPQDLAENGLSIDVFVVGREGPVASVVYRRADPDDVLRRVLHLEGRLDQNQQASGYQIQTLDNELNARLTLLQDRIDVFIEYAASLLFDRVAAVEVAQVPGAPALDEDTERKMRLFLDLVRSGAKNTASTPDRASTAERSIAPLRSSAFSQGWYDLEVDDGEEFRWMSSEGIVFNPQPEKPVREVEISVFGVYGAELPTLNCFFDGIPARVSRHHHAADGGPLQIRIRPSRSDPPSTCGMLRIESMVSASPAALEGGSDKRLLSIAVSEIAFVYAG